MPAPNTDLRQGASRQEDPCRSETPLPILLLSALVILAVCLPLLRAGLGLDETVTYWSLKDGIAESIYRVTHFENQSPLYDLLMVPIKGILGSSEVALRSLSLLSVAGACAVLYLIAKRLYGAGAAAPAVIFFVIQRDVANAATNLRHYGIALFFSILSVELLLRALENGFVRSWMRYSVAATLMIYSHFLFAAAALFHAAVVFLYAARTSRSRALKCFLVAWFAICAALAPNYPQLKLLAERRQVLSFAEVPRLADLLSVCFPLSTLLALAAAVLIGRAFPKARFDGQVLNSRWSVVMPALWWVIPPSICFAASHATGSSIFVTRYFLWASPGLALLLGAAAASFRPSGAVLAFLAGYLLVFFIGEWPSFQTEDWRGAVRRAGELSAQDQSPILAYTGFVEAQDVGWLRDPERLSYLLAPFSYYAAAEQPLALPNDCESPAANEYLAERIWPAIADRESLVVLVRLTYIAVTGGEERSDEHFLRCFQKRGYEPSEDKSFADLRVFRMRRDHSTLAE